MMEKDFNIKGTITKEDIPKRREHVKSKYQAIYDSCRTLAPGEGIEVEVDRSGMRTPIRKWLKKRLPYYHFDIAGRKRKHGYHLYIFRLS
jgi:hypothetical protein